MSNEPRFDLEHAIATWRQFHARNRVFSREDLDELEQHLRDHVVNQLRSGIPAAVAFQQALASLGDIASGEEEYEKVRWRKLHRQHRIRNELSWRVAMFKNYVTLAWRTLYQQKGYAFINIFGLAIGLTCFMLIGLFVQHELSYDRFHQNADRIYRIAREVPSNMFKGMKRGGPTPEPLVHALMEDVPEVEYATQVAHARGLLVEGDTQFHVEGLYATPHFFDVFSFPLVAGNPSTALTEPDAIVLTESLAQKYFGDANPVGQTLTLYTLSSESRNDNVELVVTGVAVDVPANSHFTFDYLVTPQASQELVQWVGSWQSNSYFTYALVRPDASLPAFKQKLITIAEQHLGAIEYYQQNPSEQGIYYPKALTDLHLYDEGAYPLGETGDIRYVYMVSAIAILILLIACFNYVNLATARSATRAKEVGVRKVLGAHRRQLIGQFLGESAIPTLLALGLALLLTILLLPTLHMLTGRQVELDVVQHSGLLLGLLGVGLGVGMLAGSYPAFLLSAFEPVRTMKGVQHQRAGKSRLRSLLVVAQFSVTIVLVVGTMVIKQQLDYLQHANTGLDRDQVIMINIEDRTLHDDRYAALKNTLQSHPSVRGVTAAQADPTDVNAASALRIWEGKQGDESILVYRSIIQQDYIDLFDLEVIEGRDFSAEAAADAREGMIINETLKERLGWETAVGKQMSFHGRDARIIGVVKDFNLHSMHRVVAPLALFQDSGWWFAYQRVFVKVKPEAMQETLGFLENTLATFSPDYPFDYQFLDDAYQQRYATEMRLGTLVTHFTVLALCIACLGLFGLAAFMASQRTKEVGVRKVLGASVWQIVQLLAGRFIGLVGVAFVVAVPVAYFIVERWLQDFAFRIEMAVDVFVVTGALVLVIVLLTVSYQAIKAALANPVESLRYE